MLLGDMRGLARVTVLRFFIDLHGVVRVTLVRNIWIGLKIVCSFDVMVLVVSPALLADVHGSVRVTLLRTFGTPAMGDVHGTVRVTLVRDSPIRAC